MRYLKLIVELIIVCFLCLTATFAFAWYPLENCCRRIPLGSGSFQKLYDLQDALKGEETKPIELERREIPVVIGNVFIETGQGAQLRSQTKNEVVVEVSGTEKAVITQSISDKSITIEYGGTTITFDSSVEIGKITVNKNGVWIYDKEGNRVGGIANNGTSFWKIKDSFVFFDKSVNLNIKGNSQGKATYIEAETDVGKYILELNGNQLAITSPSHDTITIDTSKFKSLILGRFSKEGKGWISFYTRDYDQHIRVDFNSQGKIEKVALSTRYTEQLSSNSHKMTWEKYEISLNSEEGVNLNLIPNEGESITIASNVENSVQFEFNKDGTVRVIKPDGTVVSITGDIDTATFNKDGSLTFKYKDGTEEIISPDWWDGMNLGEIIDYLERLVEERRYEETAEKFSQLAQGDFDLAVQVMEGVSNQAGAYIIGRMEDIELAVKVLEETSSTKVAEIFNAMEESEYGFLTYIISTEKAAQIIYYTMNTDKVVEVFNLTNLMGASHSLKAARAASIMKEILQISDKNSSSTEGLDKVVEIMSKMEETAVAAIMAVEEDSITISENQIDGLSIKECVDILKEMVEEKGNEILVVLDELNPRKAQRIRESLWLRAQQDESTGLVKSLKTDEEPLSDHAYTYDQALAILHFLQDGDYESAKRILDFYKNQSPRIEGAFANCYNAETGEIEEWVADVGVNSWLVIAILQYTEKTGDNSYMSLAEEIAVWVINLQKENGGIVGGYEPIDEKGHYKKVNWVSTEHNIDAYAMLMMLYKKTGDEKYKIAADKIIDWLKEEGFKNGVPHRGENDETVATDVVALAITFLGPQELVAMGLDPEDLIKFIEDECKVTVEYEKPDGTVINITGFDYTNAIETGVRDYSIISFEWTAEMISAYYTLADYYAEQGDVQKANLYREKANFFIEELNKAKIDGIIPYASKEGWTFHPDMGGWVATNYLSVASTVWYSLSCQESNPFVF